MTFVKVPFLAGIGLALGACSLTPVPEYLAKPADPNIRVPAVQYRSVTAGAATYRPAEPKDWHELNRDVGPKS
ncbi:MULTISPECIES: hypothetical protein [unclassified Bosea (in: a-proteobacteria)]|uniref:hypothetical protein n=1 Tax=unclassified Bosea (in: a-proteobacteria) TaxID=2653178 RepID=UPI000A6C3FA7|nr:MULTISPECIES: hypothetical protein [unclassified Bosea (in: a-proteobacteria)]CAH1680927.1 conserved hypothetical protein [Hyphomicrobiales bacterium]MBN9459355.1 hypothetical protein [Bosea sp. (in: a-proteobacteria)]MCR4524446.1 hypothetical protein [Bosea sp. 47.2.35]CAH1701572.1 conserved hypothetical protein [Hyphomicrobiales bacterium]CAI0345742.1 conserved hypothetical protein [Hyphomicrobiales bacterium]